MSNPSEQLQTLSDEYQKLQKDLQGVIEARQRLDSQLQENKSVKKEFSELDEDANIYKLVGPILVKQDREEATSNVDKRLEFIENETKRIEGQLKETQERMEKSKVQIVRLQTQLQQGQPPQS